MPRNDAGGQTGLGVPHPAARGLLALVLARLGEIQLTVFVPGLFIGPFFKNRLARFFRGAAFGGFSGHRNHAFLCLRYPVPYLLLFFKPVLRNWRYTAAAKPSAAPEQGGFGLFQFDQEAFLIFFQGMRPTVESNSKKGKSCGDVIFCSLGLLQEFFVLTGRLETDTYPIVGWRDLQLRTARPPVQLERTTTGPPAAVRSRVALKGGSGRARLLAHWPNECGTHTFPPTWHPRGDVC